MQAKFWLECYLQNNRKKLYCEFQSEITKFSAFLSLQGGGKCRPFQLNSKSERKQKVVQEKFTHVSNACLCFPKIPSSFHRHFRLGFLQYCAYFFRQILSRMQFKHFRLQIEYGFGGLCFFFLNQSRMTKLLLIPTCAISVCKTFSKHVCLHREEYDGVVIKCLRFGSRRVK